MIILFDENYIAIYPSSANSVWSSSDSVRAFKEKMKMGQFKEVDAEEKRHKEKMELDEKMKAESIPVGSRYCQSW